MPSISTSENHRRRTFRGNLVETSIALQSQFDDRESIFVPLTNDSRTSTIAFH
jgi:hypothetical protein